MSEQQIAEIELSKSQAESFVKTAEALDRLSKNRDFKRIISDGYLKEESIRLVSLKGAPEMQHEKHQASILKQIDAIGSLQNYFHGIYMQGDHAKALIEEAEEEIEMIRAEAEEEEQA